MIKTIFMTIIDATLGLACFCYSLIAEGALEHLFFVFLSSAYFASLILRARKASILKEKNRRYIPGRAGGGAAPILCYDDFGQAYAYEVRSGDTLVRCFSDFLFGPDSPVDLIDILIRDGKLSVENGARVEIKVNMRGKVQ